MALQNKIVKMKTFLVKDEEQIDRKNSASMDYLEAIISHRDHQRSLTPTTTTNQRRYSVCVPCDHLKEVKPARLLSRSYSHGNHSHLVDKRKSLQLLKRAARSQNKFKLRDTNTSDFKIYGIIGAIVLFCLLVTFVLYSVRQRVAIQGHTMV